MSEMQPSISSGRKFSAVWIIPLVALVVGASIVIHSFMTEGPTITLDFETAEGLEAGKTKIKLLDVKVGLVESVSIKNDMSGVTVSVKLDRKARHLLVEDTRFWVVRARIGAGGVTGLGTILAGAYIEMAPGTSLKEMGNFVGLESPPLTPADAPGLRLTLFSKRAGSVSAGNTVLYNGYEVGRVEAMTFDTERRQARYDIFVDAPYHGLIDSSTRFWDASGISFEASAEGVKIRTGSMDTVLLGGVAFGTPSGLPAGGPVENGREFKLYESYDDILKNPYRYGLYYVVSFSRSLRGLVPGAPVEYRGIQIGHVVRILLKELAAQGLQGTGEAIPVLIYLEPGRLELPDSKESITALQHSIETGVNRGLRATMVTGNLLTGKQLINIDYFPDTEVAELGEFEQYTLIPSIETGVARLEQQVSAFLDKLNSLPLEETVEEAKEVLGEANDALASLNTVLKSEEFQALPDELSAALLDLRDVLAGFSADSEMGQGLGASVNKLNAMMEGLDALIRKLSIKPNAILFPTSPEADPVPEAHPQ